MRIIPENINSGKRDKIIIYILLIIVIILCCTSGLLYYNLKNANNLEKELLELYNRSNQVENYYIKINDMYLNLREEYEYVYEEYSKLNLKNILIEKEYDEILNYKKVIMLEKEKSITLLSKENNTAIYEIPFSGYVQINFTSTDDIYFWIGSTSIEQVYYSRFPSFPDIEKSGSFMIPVLPNLVIFIANPSEESSIDLIYSIKFVY
jgi:flagellar basal body-associated protein FliL